MDNGSIGGFFMARMKLGVFALSISVISVQVATAADVTVSSPAPSATVESGFTLQAQSTTCDNIKTGSMAYSIDQGSTVSVVNAQSLNTTVSASEGSHTLHVKSWATNGAGCSTSFAITVKASSASSSNWPVAIPGDAVSYADIERESGWSSDADSSISPNPPAVYTINSSGSPAVVTLATKGRSGLYTGWMAKKTISFKAGQVHMLVRASYTFDSVSGIQAWEMGRRLTNSNGITDNGQTQLVPLSNGQLEFDIVPSSSGGWKDTGCRFATFVTGETNDEELYYVDDSNGALSLMYVSLNGKVCDIPSSLQNITGSSAGWAKDSAVMAFQPDANRSAVEYKAVIKMNAWMW
jgi:hypothetical protein